MNGSGAQPSGSHGHPHHGVDRALYTLLDAIRKSRMDVFDCDRACMQADANLTWGSLGQILGILRGCTYLARLIQVRNPVSLGCSASRNDLGGSPCLQDAVGQLVREGCLGIPGHGVHSRSRDTEKPCATH